MRALVPIVVALLPLTSACVHTNATVLDNSAKRPQLAARDVVIYRTAGSVPGNYEELALLSSRGDALWTGQSGMIEDMREEAAALGANGVILDAMSEPSAAVQVLAQVFGTGANRRGSAIAVYVHRDAEAPLLTASMAPAAPAMSDAPPQPAFLADVNRLPAAAPPSNPRRTTCSIDPETGAAYNCREAR